MNSVTTQLGRLLEPVVACLSPDVAAKVTELRADHLLQARLDYLALRCNAGLLTQEEREEYAGVVHTLNLIAILQTKSRRFIGESDQD